MQEQKQKVISPVSSLLLAPTAHIGETFVKYL